MDSAKIRRLTVILVTGIFLSFLVPGAIAQNANPFELIGAIENLSLNTITVNQQSIDISAAQVNAALQIGTVVQVEGTLNPNGTILAREVNAVAAGVQVGEVEIVGLAESLNGTTLVVNGQSVDVSVAQIGQGVAVGQIVKVHATATGLNSWLAREVALFQANTAPAQPTPAGEFEITGTLESISNGVIVVSGQTISIIGAEVRDPLLLGARVKVHLSLVNGQFTAREIENAAGDDDNGNDNGNLNSNSNDNNNANQNGNANSNANGNDNVNATPAITVQQAIQTVLEVYPTTVIRSVELTTRFGGTLVWEIEIGNRAELTVDAQTGVILTIEQPGGDDDNGNGNNNDNNDDDDNLNGNGNSNDNGDDGNNQNGNGNDNNDDHGGDNDDDNSGGGSDDDDNSGRGSGDDDDDNSGHGSDDD